MTVVFKFFTTSKKLIMSTTCLVFSTFIQFSLEFNTVGFFVRLDNTTIKRLTQFMSNNGDFCFV